MLPLPLSVLLLRLTLTLCMMKSLSRAWLIAFPPPPSPPHSNPIPHSLLLDRVAPATRLLEKRRQMFEVCVVYAAVYRGARCLCVCVGPRKVQEALDAQKEEFARKEEAFRRREEALRKKDLDLQESLIRFNKFLQVQGA